MNGQEQNDEYWTIERILATGVSAILALFLVFPQLSAPGSNWYLTTTSIFSLAMIIIAIYPVLSISFKPFPETIARNISLLGFLVFALLAILQVSLYLAALPVFTFGGLISALRWFGVTVGMCGLSYWYTVLGKRFLDSSEPTVGGLTLPPPTDNTSLHP